MNLFGGYSEVSGADDSSTWHVTGGTIDFLHALGSSTVYVSAGHQDMLIGHDTSTIHISGGSVAMLRSGDPEGSGFQGPDSNVIFIAGGLFNNPCGRISDAAGRLQGVRASGDPIDATFDIYDQASIVLVPEPSWHLQQLNVLSDAGVRGLAAGLLPSARCSGTIYSLIGRALLQ